HELHQMLKKKEVKSKELTESVYARIDKVEPKIKAYVTLTRDIAMEQAEKADQRIAKGDTIAPLTGIPIAIKDVICTKGIRTTCSSKILHNFVPPYNATVTERLLAQDVVVIGKTNMDEFAMGSSTETSYFGTTRNPWNLDTVPGGSSGGSAATIAADMAIVSLGSDTGGSIRQPGACCGIVGLKPTYGRVSRFGLIAYASSLDCIGPMTKDVTDAARLMNVIAGHDNFDSTSVDLTVPDYTQSLVDNVKGLKIGMPKEYFISGLDPRVEKSVKDAIKLLESLGAEVIEISLPHTDYAVAVYYLIATAEASSNLARFDGVKYGYRTDKFEDMIDMYMKSRNEGFGREVKRRIMLGTHVLSAGYYDAYYLKAQKVRTLIRQDFEKAFELCDVILTPTAPTPAFKIGEKMTDPLQMYLSDIFTISVNLAGIPGININCGFADGLPVGLQILAKHFDEPTIFRVAYTFESHTDFHKKKPLL
ncbi:MAG: Asp-tRNA(Asn)/Glu-tRNA(Gln) amidotransferase subunit GatA, partial [bacterium]|nr:Asp-tRNA(Asn)/Glu-tRNA(Gln) amidotransferase subunit GatA [bacterium]